ncbi:hypothetical protein V6N13_043830 [Hibiscus sabdariffa]|uniref:Uncharacterized protein n=1 Tax=Hibiscus sabdariffa TaxID=183260 RepID=A0ABR2RGP8_9ROSI
MSRDSMPLKSIFFFRQIFTSNCTHKKKKTLIRQKRNVAVVVTSGEHVKLRQSQRLFDIYPKNPPTMASATGHAICLTSGGDGNNINRLVSNRSYGGVIPRG